AVLCGPDQLTYSELNSRANQLGYYLQELGVGPGVVVGLYLERSMEMVTALLGVLKAGGAYLPLDSESPVERQAWMVRDIKAPVLLTQRHLLERLSTSQARLVCLDSQWEEISSHSPQAVPFRSGPDNLAYVIYTSGSTGKPKASAVYHRGVTNL